MKSSFVPVQQGAPSQGMGPQDSNGSIVAPSTSPGGGGGSGGPSLPPNAIHKRNYQACNPCRERKVKCNLGSVDQPNQGPCLRCQREMKQCTFTDTRRKRKANDEKDSSEDRDDSVHAEKRRTSNGAENGVSHRHATWGNDMPTDSFFELRNAQFQPQNARVAQSEDPRLAEVAALNAKEYPNDPAVRMDSNIAGMVFAAPIHSQRDALDSLVHAAAVSKRADEENAQKGSARTADAHNRGMISKHPAMSYIMDPQGQVDPQAERGLLAWKSCHFVKLQWFTEVEGVEYVHHFYDQLAPLTPIEIPNFRDVKTHPRLLLEEPLLATTILTIASRSLPLEGQGAEMRRYDIHNNLWKTLKGSIDRMSWGQDYFGVCIVDDGFLHSQPGQSTPQVLRSMGMVESLLLLSDWLPRAIHSPSEDFSGSLLTSPSVMLSPVVGNMPSQWFEAALRTDTLCWGLVGRAYMLGLELGVFDSVLEVGYLAPHTNAKTGHDSQRADRLGRMLYVYVTQTCGRLSLPNLMAISGTEPNSDFLQMEDSPSLNATHNGRGSMADTIQRAWASLTTIIRSSNAEMFGSKRRTSQRIASGDFMEFLHEYGRQLGKWRKQFERFQGNAKVVVMIEYEHARAFINSVALQAVIEKIKQVNALEREKPSTQQGAPPALFSPEVSREYRNVWYFIQEVIDACRHILRMTSSKLLPAKSLRHAPVRTFFRILSGVTILMKALTLGGKEAEVNKSLDLIKGTIIALRAESSEDFNVSQRIADTLDDLLMALARSLRTLHIPGHIANSGAGPAVTGTALEGRRPESHGEDGSSSSGQHEDFFAKHSMDKPPRVDPNDPNISMIAPLEYLMSDDINDQSFGPVDSPNTDFPSAQSGGFQGPGLPALVGNSQQRNLPRLSTSTSATLGSAMPSITADSPTDGYRWMASDFHHHRMFDQDDDLDAFDSQETSAQGMYSGPAQNAAAHFHPAMLSGLFGDAQASTSRFSNMKTPFMGGPFGPPIAENASFIGALGHGRSDTTFASDSGAGGAPRAAPYTGGSQSARPSMGSWNAHHAGYGRTRAME